MPFCWKSFLGQRMSTSEQPKKKWKDLLLRSGVPLEYEVAKIISKHDFQVFADYGFSRRDGDVRKEWSVDIAASLEVNGKRLPFYILKLLVECKYRSNEKIMIFFPEPLNKYPQSTVGATIYSCDGFAPFFISNDPRYNVDLRYPIAYKGIELHEGGAVEEEIRRGITQLRYATPSALLELLDCSIGDFPSEGFAFFLSKILVTNAPLRMVNEGVVLSTIMAAETLDDISTLTDTVVLFFDYGPDFENHFRETFSNARHYFLKRAKERRKEQKELGVHHKFYKNPTDYISEISDGARSECGQVSNQFFVTTLSGLPGLLGEIKRCCTKSVKSRAKTLDEVVKQ
jgi:5S rRNA maturation endonuclease (ribonuclease M5)